MPPAFMPEALHIGRLRDDEIEPLVALARRVWHAHYPGIITPEQIDYMLAQRYKSALIRQTLARGDHWLAARLGDTLVGFAHGYPVGEGDYKLDKLYVDLDWQRVGIGGQLLARTADYARRSACSRLVLRVNKHNASAIAAYQKHGFNLASELVEDIGNGFVMDDYILLKEL